MRFCSTLLLLALAPAAGCSGSDESVAGDTSPTGTGASSSAAGGTTSAQGGSSTGGASASGGASNGGMSSGGTSQGTGGEPGEPQTYCAQLDAGAAGLSPVPDDAISVSTTDQLTQAIEAAENGAVIVIEDGTYSNVVATLNAENVIVRAHTPGEVTLSGTSTLTLEGSGNTLAGIIFTDGEPSSARGAVFVDGNDNRVSNVAIVNFNGTDQKWLSVRGQRHEVDHCLFDGKNTVGALLTVWRDDSTPDYANIHHNLFRDYESGGGQNGWETIRLGTSTESQSDSESQIECNLFLRCNGEIEIVSVKSGANVIRANTVVDSVGLLTSRHGKGNRFEDNVILTGGLGGGGIRLYDEGHTVRNNYVEGVRTSSQVRGGLVLAAGATTRDMRTTTLNGQWTFAESRIEGNTIVNSAQSFVYGPDATEAPWDIAFENNVVRNNINGDGTFPLIREETSLDSPTYQDEIYFGSQLGIEAPTGISTDAFDLTQNEQGLWLHMDAGAQDLERLNEDQVGVGYSL